MEQSNSWLEQRNDNYKSSAVQIQSHVLSLEQEKVSERVLSSVKINNYCNSFDDFKLSNISNDCLIF